MNAKPIIFNTSMVQAILDGRKTQMRQVFIPQPKYTIFAFERDPYETRYIEYSKEARADPKTKSIKGYRHIPKYKIGDVLWVREKTYGFANGTDNHDMCYATHCPCGLSDEEHAKVKGWKPSTHMPRAAARIFLRVTSLRVKRLLQDISRDDALAEGINSPCRSFGYHSEYCLCIDKYSELWNSINAKRGYGWEANPWVWVYEFERVDG